MDKEDDTHTHTHPTKAKKCEITRATKKEEKNETMLGRKDEMDRCRGGLNAGAAPQKSPQEKQQQKQIHGVTIMAASEDNGRCTLVGVWCWDWERHLGNCSCP